VAAALATGASSLVLLAGAAPGAELRAALAARFPSARLAAAVVDASTLASPRALLRALYSSRPPGAGPILGAVAPPRLVGAEATAAPLAAAAPAAPQPAQLPGVAPSPAPAAAVLAFMPAATPAAALEQLVASVVGDLLGAPPGAAPLAADEPLMAAGVTSTLAVALTGRLEERLGVALPPTLVRLACWVGRVPGYGLPCGSARLAPVSSLAV
jgi:hypothetical protein